ncbi:MAG TPA: hypothetical protein PLP07_10330 [Pyrinomonadaceae bacterium]|nr:hypothetical protein [Chloracidobacterium sp.]MBP9935390.1 hypothetical protein [Pyrinomonadaceae bacterium]MBK7803556.1 hypothetical protein [Chloracidobacterium sp.]MBK9438802.1 hypothetical protein [Chloracidobacterium sp.]MBK9766872.1 hypothetical protein [Chloracidobacterium sp.]
MKILILSFIVYLSLLSAHPCRAASLLVSDQNGDRSAAIQVAGDDVYSEECPTCCTFVCCDDTLAVYPFAFDGNGGIDPAISNHIVDHRRPYNSADPIRIWLPPKA